MKILALLFLLLTGCTSPMMLPPSGTWESQTSTLGPVVVCKGGNFASEPEGCNQWPLSIPSMPHPDIHYGELRAKASETYSVDAALIVLKDVIVEYTTEINGVIRGWKASAVAGKR